MDELGEWVAGHAEKSRRSGIFRLLPVSDAVVIILVMKTVLVLLRSNAAEWVALLQRALPHHRIIDGYATAPTGEVQYAVVGKPAPGTFASLSGLEAIFSVNAGVEGLLATDDLPAGVPIVRMVDEGLAAGMLEWVLATVLAWHRNLFDYRTRQLALDWSPLRERVAGERIVTVLGTGHLGGRAAATLASLGFQVRGWSRTGKDIPGVVGFVGREGLNDAIAGADFLVNLLPLTAETENLIDHALLGRLAPQAVLINGGRGRHVVDADVLAQLDSGHLRAAVLDVFRAEPLATDDPLWRHPGVYLSPHVAAPTHAGSAVEAIVSNLKGYEAGQPLKHVVDPARGY
jgi:glyoxylate/hydroxypyruvate reductase A